jgi:guanidinoacetate N-methyltransferase
MNVQTDVTDRPETTVLDTVQSRVDIGFGTREDWCKSAAVFTDDTLRIAGHPVMERWESSYMSRLASIASVAGGRVLEVGYGMGISASALLQDENVKSYTVIECHPGVATQALNRLTDEIASARARVMVGFWEAVTPLLDDESFDGILFDTYPLTASDIHQNHYAFFPEAFRLLRSGGVLTYYSDEAQQFSPAHAARLRDVGFTDVNFEVCDIDTPADCEYWRFDTMIAPLIRKP